MRLVTNFLAGILLTGMLALAPKISFARGGGGGGQSVDHLSVTGQIDGQTLQALGIA